MFAPPRLDAVVLMASLLLTPLLQAQTTSSSKTLGDLIDQAKRNKSMAYANSAANPLPSVPDTKTSKPVAQSIAAADPANTPLLWTLVGMNSQMVAEIIYKEKVHTLHLHQGQIQIGPWLVDRYGASGLYLVPAKTSRKTPSVPSLFLPAPTSGASLEQFATALPAPISRMDGMGEGYASQSGPLLGRIMPPSMLGEPGSAGNGQAKAP